LALWTDVLPARAHVRKVDSESRVGSRCYILDELVCVLPRLNHRLKWQPADFSDIVDILAVEAERVEPTPSARDRLRDAKDVPVLGTLLAAGADYLITGDSNLLALAGRYSIVTPAAFWRRHGG
jgi:putative PIN family toxin of toxin-antitoxin system